MKNKLIFFGAGHYGELAYKKFGTDYEIICFVDNNKNIQGSVKCGKSIVSPEKIQDMMDDDTSLIICSIYYLEIEKQLKAMGIKDYYIFLDDTLFLNSKPNSEKKIIRCKRCIMDNSSDDKILFDDRGYCNYCISAERNIGKVYFPNEDGKNKVTDLLYQIKKDSRNKKYDCIMGLSGGLDSSYLTYLGYKWGLRILIVHIDDGFDTEISKNNIRRLIEKTGYDMEVVRPDAKQFADLTLSYMRAGVPNVAVPQDNLILAYIYKKIQEHGIRYFLSGGNFALECILQRGNTYINTDTRNLKNIHKKFGKLPIDKLEFISEDEIKHLKVDLGIETVRPLDLVDYNRERAFKELKEFCGFEYYGRKHLENILTEFIQLYWFPKKFGVDKRTSHLSSMIISGQMTREEALKEYAEPLYDEEKMKRCIAVVKEKLNISEQEFENIMSGSIHSHEEYN